MLGASPLVWDLAIMAYGERSHSGDQGVGDGGDRRDRAVKVGVSITCQQAEEQDQ